MIKFHSNLFLLGIAPEHPVELNRSLNSLPFSVSSSNTGNGNLHICEDGCGWAKNVDKSKRKELLSYNLPPSPTSASGSVSGGIVLCTSKVSSLSSEKSRIG